MEINGFRLNEGGGFVVTNNSGIWLWDGADTTRLIADRAGSERCQMNDCIADPTGRLLSGSWFYDPNGGYPLGHLMQVDTDGHVRVLDDGFLLANGLGFSLDYRTLYFTDSVARRIYAYDYRPETVMRATAGRSARCLVTRVCPTASPWMPKAFFGRPIGTAVALCVTTRTGRWSDGSLRPPSRPRA